MAKPKIIIADWKAYVESNPKGSLVYKKLYQPLEERFECIPVFSENEIPKEVLTNGTYALVIHPLQGYMDGDILENKILKVIVSSYPEEYERGWASVDKQNVKFVGFDSDAIKSALEDSFR